MNSPKVIYPSEFFGFEHAINLQFLFLTLCKLDYLGKSLDKEFQAFFASQESCAKPRGSYP